MTRKNATLSPKGHLLHKAILPRLEGIANIPKTHNHREAAKMRGKTNIPNETSKLQKDH